MARAVVYSYAEDEMVLDPKLADHLAHWGINMMQMEKGWPALLLSKVIEKFFYTLIYINVSKIVFVFFKRLMNFAQNYSPKKSPKNN